MTSRPCTSTFTNCFPAVPLKDMHHTLISCPSLTALEATYSCAHDLFFRFSNDTDTSTAQDTAFPRLPCRCVPPPPCSSIADPDRRSTLPLSLALQIQVTRRAYECLFVHKFSPNAMNLFQFIAGLSFYGAASFDVMELLANPELNVFSKPSWSQVAAFALFLYCK